MNIWLNKQKKIKKHLCLICFNVDCYMYADVRRTAEFYGTR